MSRTAPGNDKGLAIVQWATPDVSEPVMPQYRLYMLDEHGGYGRCVDLDCVNDEQAEKAAAKHHRGAAMVLWGKNRIIAKIEKEPGRGT